MNTNLQEIYNSFFMKTPNEDFSYKQDLVFQYLKTAQSRAYKIVPENLDNNVLKDVILNEDAIIIPLKSSEKDGEIQIQINDDIFILKINITDNLNNIAKNIENIIDNERYDVNIDFDNQFPIVKITSVNLVPIKINIVDIDMLNAKFIVTRSYEGIYLKELGQDTIDFLALLMKYQHYSRELSSLVKSKQHIGTQSFNKLPVLKDKYLFALETLKVIDNQILMKKQDFFTYEQ